MKWSAIALVGMVCLGCGGEGPSAIVDTSTAETCVATDPCTVTWEEGGACKLARVPGCEVCVAEGGSVGSSRDGGACCGGCWAGSTCYATDTDSACGQGGGLCTSCIGAASCSDGVCQ